MRIVPVATNCYIRKLESRGENKSGNKIDWFVSVFCLCLGKDTGRLVLEPGLSDWSVGFPRRANRAQLEPAVCYVASGVW